MSTKNKIFSAFFKKARIQNTVWIHKYAYYDPEGDPTGVITGTVDCLGNINMHYQRPPGYNYYADFQGTIAPDGNSISGTWTDSGSYADEDWVMRRL